MNSSCDNKGREVRNKILPSLLLDWRSTSPYPEKYSNGSWNASQLSWLLQTTNLPFLAWEQSTSPLRSVATCLMSLCGMRVRGTAHLQSPPKNPGWIVWLHMHLRETPQVLPLCQSQGQHDPHTGFYEQTLQWWHWPAEDILRWYQAKGEQKVSVSLCVAHTIQCCLPFVYLLLLLPTPCRNNSLKSTTQGF